jgi:hypothetical protein
MDEVVGATPLSTLVDQAADNGATLPPAVQQAVWDAYRLLEGKAGLVHGDLNLDNVLVLVRDSCTTGSVTATIIDYGRAYAPKDGVPPGRHAAMLLRAHPKLRQVAPLLGQWSLEVRGGGGAPCVFCCFCTGRPFVGPECTQAEAPPPLWYVDERVAAFVPCRFTAPIHHVLLGLMIAPLRHVGAIDSLGRADVTLVMHMARVGAALLCRWAPVMRDGFHDRLGRPHAPPLQPYMAPPAEALALQDTAPATELPSANGESPCLRLPDGRVLMTRFKFHRPPDSTQEHLHLHVQAFSSSARNPRERYQYTLREPSARCLVAELLGLLPPPDPCAAGYRGTAPDPRAQALDWASVERHLSP